MTRITPLYFAVLALFAPVIYACDSGPPDSNDSHDESAQMAQDTNPTRVDSEDSDGSNTSPGDTASRDANRNEDIGGDGQRDDPTPPEYILDCSVDIQPEPSSYICPDGKSHQVSYTSEKRRVSAPDENKGGPSTVDEIRERFGGAFPEKGTSLTVAKRHRPDSPLTHAYAEPGEDVVIHFATIHPRDNYGDSSLKVAAMLNYRPVDGIYEHYNYDRSKVLDRHKGIGGNIPIDGEAELVDITIPAEAFDGPGRYDIGLGWEFDGPVDNPSGWRRIAIYYGGCTPANHECLVRGKQAEANDTEREIAEEYFVGGFVYPGGEHAGQGPLEVELDKGQRVTVNFSLFNSQDPVSHPYAVVPTVRDKPLDKRFLVVTEPRGNGGAIGYRGDFEVEIPDKPGRYDVEVGIWKAPFLEPGDYPELGFGEIEHTSLQKFGTNDVVYIVNE